MRREKRRSKIKLIKDKIEDTNILFENVFGPNRVCSPIASMHRKKYFTDYMPIGVGKFLHGHSIVRKADVYVYETSSDSMTRTSVPIKDPLVRCKLPFADGKVLPTNSNNFDRWYQLLPIHKMFLKGQDNEIHYLAPDNLQPNYPCVYLDWKVDKDDEPNVNESWERDKYDFYDETGATTIELKMY